MRQLLIDGSYFVRKAYTAYAKIKGDVAPGPAHLLHACVNRLFSITRPENLGPHQVTMVLRSISDTMPAHFQAQQAALPAQLSAFGIKVVQLPDKGNVERLCQLANSPEFQASGVTIGSDHDFFIGYLSATAWVLKNDKVRALRRDRLPDALGLADPALLPAEAELAAFVTLQSMPRYGTGTAAKYIARWRQMNLFTGFGQNPAELGPRFADSPDADTKRFDPAFWAAFAAQWQAIFPPDAAERLADHTLPRPSREAVTAELNYYKFTQLAHYTTTTDWADGIVC